MMSLRSSSHTDSSHANAKPPRRFCRRVLPYFLGVGLLGALALGGYSIYLDHTIRQKMNGNIWQLPAEVYSRVEEIRRADQPSFEQIKQMLLDNGYRQTAQIGRSGDFKIDGNKITLVRRDFPFPNGEEPQRVLRLVFLDGKLHRIEDLVRARAIEQFSLDPKMIGMLQSSSDEERVAIPLKKYPRHLIDALLLTEDRKFFTHHGISLLGIGRALVANYQAGQTVQGASTLTQQLVKNLFLTRERSFTRKFNEAIMALLLDARYEKSRILETYLNEVYLGQNGSYQVHGFALASQFYFGRPIQEISLDQIAMLVGMVKGPSLYNPWKHPKETLERRNVVLKLLQESQIINAKLYDILSKRPLGVQEKGRIYRQQPAFMQALNQDLEAAFGEKRHEALAGARIFTTLDRKLQRSAELAVINGVAEIEERNRLANLQSAVVVAEYKTGKVRAMVGDKNTQFAGFNRAMQSQRQIGSLVKPSIYAMALANPDRFRLTTPIANQSRTIYVGSTPWTPRNYDHRTSGPVLLVDALVRSMNIPTVNIGMALGVKNVIAKQKEMGWDKVNIPAYPSMLLGAYAISPYDVTKVYQVLANQGEKHTLTTIDSIRSHEGKLIYQPNTEAKNVLPAQATVQALYAMQQVVKRGTARSLQNGFAHLALAGKTGTTNDARDTWFVGVDGENVSTVWLGKDNNSNTHLTGSSGALQVYRHYLERAQPKTLTLPAVPQVRWVSAFGGHISCEGGTKMPYWFNKGAVPCANASAYPPAETVQPPRHTAEPEATLGD